MARRERGEAQEDDYHVAQEESHIIKKECNDVFFLIVFLAAIITTIVFAGKYGSDFIEATKIVKDVGSTAIEATGTKSAFEIILKYVFVSTCAAAGMSILWIVLMILAGEFLIWLALGVIIILNILTAYFFTKELYGSGEKYYYWPAIVFGLFALLTILYVCCIRVSFIKLHIFIYNLL
jgi:magnesium-transporting ATPase (P-type)